MVEILIEKEEVVIISKSGARTLMPNLEFAKQRANGLWAGEVKKIEVTTTYIVADEKTFREELDDLKDKILQLESDLESIGSYEVAKLIEDELKKLYRKKDELQYSLEIINKN